jgi:hypothetical protein
MMKTTKQRRKIKIRLYSPMARRWKQIAELNKGLIK